MNEDEACMIDDGRQRGPVSLSFVLPVRGNVEQALACADDLHRHAAGEGLSAASVEVIMVVAGEQSEQHRHGDSAAGAGLDSGLGAGPGLRILSGHRASRGGQMRSGAAVATGELVVFHHPDNPLRQAHVRSLLDVAREPVIAGGAFYRDLCHCWPGWGFLEPLARWWQMKYGILYGDQTCFVRREVYQAVGGMPDMVLMEDVELSRRLRKWGSLRFLDPPVQPDMSRFMRDGRWRRKLENLALILLYRTGASPRRLNSIYNRRAGRVPQGARRVRSGDRNEHESADHVR
jgi:hypothetical protein